MPASDQSDWIAVLNFTKTYFILLTLLGFGGFPDLAEGGTPPTIMNGVMLVTCLTLTCGSLPAIVVTQ